MVLERQFSVRLLDLIGRGALVYSQKLVELGIAHRAAAPRHAPWHAPRHAFKSWEAAESKHPVWHRPALCAGVAGALREKDREAPAFSALAWRAAAGGSKNARRRTGKPAGGGREAEGGPLPGTRGGGGGSGGVGRLAPNAHEGEQPWWLSKEWLRYCCSWLDCAAVFAHTGCGATCVGRRTPASHRLLCCLATSSASTASPAGRAGAAHPTSPRQPHGQHTRVHHDPTSPPAGQASHGSMAARRQRAAR